MEIKFLLLALLIIIGCTPQDEEIKYFPKDFRGVWIDNYWEVKLEITETEIFEIHFSSDYSDTIKREFRGLYKIKRSKCEDCLHYGIKIKYDSEIDEEDIILVHTFHPELKKYMVIELINSAVEPYSKLRSYQKEAILNRSIK